MTSPTKDSILVIGAGELGHAVLSALHASAHPHQISILLRPGTLASNPTLAPSLQTRYGATAVPGDYAADALDSLTATFRRFDTVVVCSGYGHLTAGLQIKLAQAVLAAGVRRYLPWQFGVDYDVLGPPGTAGEGMFDEQVQVRAMLRAQREVGYVILSVGMFSTFLFEPFGNAVEFGDDDGNRKEEGRKVTVRGLGGWDVRFTATTPEDIGTCVADVLDAWDGRAGEEAKKMLEQDLESSRGVVFLAGETLSYARFADGVERAVRSVAGGAQDAVHVTRELWDLPYLEAKLAEDPTDGLRRYRTIFAQSRGIAWDYEGSWNARRGIPTTSVEEFAKKLLIEQGEK